MSLLHCHELLQRLNEQRGKRIWFLEISEFDALPKLIYFHVSDTLCRTLWLHGIFSVKNRYWIGNIGLSCDWFFDYPSECRDEQLFLPIHPSIQINIIMIAANCSLLHISVFCVFVPFGNNGYTRKMAESFMFLSVVRLSFIKHTDSQRKRECCVMG